MAFLAVPQPFDFELTTERFRVFGPDLVTLWSEWLHRVVGGRRFGSRPRPAALTSSRSTTTGRVVLSVLGAEFDLAGFELDPVLAPEVARLRGFRPGARA